MTAHFDTSIGWSSHDTGSYIRLVLTLAVTEFWVNFFLMAVIELNRYLRDSTQKGLRYCKTHTYKILFYVKNRSIFLSLSMETHNVYMN